jgi:molecular chaperone DnaK
LFEITQGEDTDPNYVDIIDEVILELPKGRPEGQPIDVTYSYDENQIMHCKIYDVNSKREKSKEINLSLGNKNPLNDFDLL